VRMRREKKRAADFIRRLSLAGLFALVEDR
jgi:hypothetical protein